MLTGKLYRYAVDRINGRFLSGWCFNRLYKAKPVTVTITGDDCPLGSVRNDRFRPDLLEQALHPTGVCGFDFNFPAGFDPGRYRKVCIYFDRSRRPAATIDCRDIPLLRPRDEVRIFFMHIPKTAGTSFNAFARGCFEAHSYKVHLERMPEGEQQSAVRTCSFVSGHVNWQRISQFAGLDSFDLYALLREPYAHLHSHLNYLREVYRNAHQEVYFDFRHNATIHEVGRRLEQIDFSSPDQAEGFVAGLHGVQRDFFDNLQTRYFLDYRPEYVSMEDGDAAIANLTHFRLVGLTEQYDEFRKRFCRAIGIAPQPQPLKSNRSKSYRLFDPEQPEAREILRPLVASDLRLYETVRQHFHWSDQADQGVI